jgi:hypothetical protein
MTGKLKRVQMLLEPRQHAALADIAKQQGKSVAEVTRQLIDLGLATLNQDDEFTRRASALRKAEGLRHKLEERHGRPLTINVGVDLADIREKRDERIANSGR